MVAPDTLSAMRVVLPRSAGVLLHPTSLASGKLDDDAYRFIDWLALAGVGWWQVLPLSPPDPLGSPYASPSAFAASPALLARLTRPSGSMPPRRFAPASATGSNTGLGTEAERHSMTRFASIANGRLSEPMRMTAASA